MEPGPPRPTPAGYTRLPSLTSPWIQETYKGTGANSEPETRAVAEAILAVKDAVRIYLSFHSYGEHPIGLTIR